MKQTQPRRKAINQSSVNDSDTKQSFFSKNSPPTTTVQYKLSKAIANSPRMAAQHAATQRINQSSRMVAQRRGLESMFGQPVQRKGSGESRARTNHTGLPDSLKAGIENLSGLAMDDVKVHYNSSKPAQLQALAYTQGTEIEVAPGQEQHLPHEAWHVVQQKQGRVRPTVQMKGRGVNNDSGLEKEADLMGKQAVQHGSISSQQQEAPGLTVATNEHSPSPMLSMPVVQCMIGEGNDKLREREVRTPIGEVGVITNSYNSTLGISYDVTLRNGEVIRVGAQDQGYELLTPQVLSSNVSMASSDKTKVAGTETLFSTTTVPPLEYEPYNYSPSYYPNKIDTPSSPNTKQPSQEEILIIDDKTSAIAKSEKSASGKLNHSDLHPKLTISEISMLGTHDAGTYMYSRRRTKAAGAKGIPSAGTLAPRAFKCQSLDLVEQAEAGVNYFDIRVKKDKKGKYRFFHGPSDTKGNALTEVEKLIEHTSADNKNLYMFKFHFKKQADQAFLDDLIQATGCQNHLISKDANSEKSLGSITLSDSIGQGKNLAFMTKTDEKKKEKKKSWIRWRRKEKEQAQQSIENSPFAASVWNYDKNNVFTGWGNTPDVKKQTEHLKKMAKESAEINDKKITITQTNMPFVNPKQRPKWPFGVKGLAKRNHAEVADTVSSSFFGKNINPGVISIDYAEKEKDIRSSTQRYLKEIQLWNKYISERKAYEEAHPEDERTFSKGAEARVTEEELLSDDDETLVANDEFFSEDEKTLHENE